MLHQLGSGGMGSVWLAREQATGHEVAIKFLTCADHERQLRFGREMQVATQLHHEHLVTVLGHSGDAPEPFLVMEYIAGGDLRQSLLPGQPMDLDETTRILGEILAALSYLAREGIVHRDLKPENVLLTPEGQVKLADFGLASRVSQLGELTQTGQVLGSYDYMAPEQRARLPLDHRADQYSLAVLAYEMLTGKRPLGRFKPVSTLNTRLDPRLDAVLARALQEDPDDRYPTIDEFGTALMAALKPRPRGRRWIVLTVGGLLVIVGMIVAARRDWYQPTAPTEPIEQEVTKTTPPNEPPKPSRFEELMRLGQYHDGRAERVLAIRCYTEAIQLAPHEPMPWIRRAHDQMLLNRYDEALADIHQALKLDPNQAEAWVGHGAILLQQGKVSEALPLFDRALQLDASHAIAHAHRGRVHLRLNDRDKALADFDRAIALDPNCGIAYYYRGIIARDQKRYRQSLEDHRKSVECTPDNPFAHRSLASLLATCPDRSIRDGKQAVFHARQACEITGWKSWRELLVLAQSQAEVGDYSEAVAALKKSLSLSPPASERTKQQKLLQEYENRLSNPKGSTP